MVGRTVFRVLSVGLFCAAGLFVCGSVVSVADTGKSSSAEIYRKDAFARELSSGVVSLHDRNPVSHEIHTGSSGKVSYRGKSRYQKDYEKRKARISPYSGPELSLPQIYTRKKRKTHPELKAPDFKQLTRTGSSYIFSKQVLVRQKMLASPYYNLKLREKDPVCAKPYGSKTEAEYAAVLNGLPLVVWLNENNKKKLEFDPNNIFPKKFQEDEGVGDYGIVIESEPEDLDIGVSVQYY